MQIRIMIAFLICSSIPSLLLSQQTELPETRKIIYYRNLSSESIDSVTYECTITNHKKLDLSYLDIPDISAAQSELASLVYYKEPDIPAYLLQKGLARIEPDHQVAEHLQTVQQFAMATRVGLWKTETEPTSQVSEDPAPEAENRVLSLLRKIPTYVWQFLVAAAVLGLPLRRAVVWAYKKFYITQRVSLLIIGEAASGKTGLLLRLYQPRIEPSEILNLSPSRAHQIKALRKPIPYSGKFQIYPRLVDIPGAKYGFALDSLSTRPDVVVLVLAHTSSKDSADADSTRITEQLEYVKILIQGVLDSKTFRNPKMVVLFLTKFDLLSSHPPQDSAARSEVDRIENIFASHIDAAKVACQRQSIPFRCIIGSALMGWNCERIKTEIAEALYD